MKVYFDRETNEDHISTAFPIEEVFNGTVMKVPVKWGRYSDNEEVQLEGANPSAEDAVEESSADDNKERRLDVQHQFGLIKIDFLTKSGFKAWVLECVGKSSAPGQWTTTYKKELEDDKNSKEEVEDKMKAWKAGLMEFVNFIAKQWKNCDVYYDKEQNVDGAKVFYIGDENGDHMYFIKCCYKYSEY